LLRTPLELLDQLVGDLLLGPAVDLVNGLVEQLHERVGDLALAQMQQRGEQHQPNRLIVASEMTGRLDRGPRPPRGDDVRGDPGEQVARQVDMANRLELAHLREHGRETDVARARLDRAQRVLVRLYLAVHRVGLDVAVEACAQQRLDAGDVPALQASDDGRYQHRVGLADPGVDDPRGPLGRRRLDPLVPAVRQQQGAHVLDAPLVLGDVGPKPARELLGIRDAADPKPRVVADLPAVVLDLAAREVIGADLRRGHLHLPREMLDRVVGQLEPPPRKAALPAEELQHRREPQPRRARLVAQQLPLAIAKREVLDDIVKADVTPRRRSLRRTLGPGGGAPSDRRAHIAST
jgi:hypothetical protein